MLKKNNKLIYLALLTTIALIIIVLTAALNRQLKANSSVELKRLTYNEFVTQVEAGQVGTVEFSTGTPFLKGQLKDGTQFTTDNLGTPEFKKYLLEKGVTLTIPPARTNLWSSVPNIITSFLLLWLIATVGKGLSSLRTPSLNNNAAVKCYTTFNNVAGNEEAKENLKDLVDFLKDPAKYHRFGAKLPKGTILYGPPGTGKTLLAKALAGTAGVNFISVSGSDFVEKYVGVGAARVRQLFATARAKAPCIIFIDELDAVGKRRSGHGYNDERDQTLNQILTEMDGFTGNEGVIVLAATNRLDTLDPALLRSGRFDRHIRVDLPDVTARYEILKLHAHNKPLSDEVDLRTIAQMTTFMSGADLENILNEASIFAAKQGHQTITMSDIDYAINKLTVGEEKRNRDALHKRDKEVAAIHEAGHAVVAKLYAQRTVPKVTIIPTTNGAGGYTLISPEERMQTKDDMVKDIAIALGGRAAEEICFGSEYITGGASQDLVRVTEIASLMARKLGMSKRIGLVNLDALCESEIGDITSLLLDETRVLLDKIYRGVYAFLQEKKEVVYNLAQELLKRETIYEKDLDELLFALNEN